MRAHDSDSAFPSATDASEVVGLVPAAGKGKRIAPLPCSKELYPVGFEATQEHGERRPKVVSQYLLEKLRLARVQTAFVVLREGKWDIPAYFGDGGMLDMHLAYIVIEGSQGPPDTIDRAYPFVRGKTVAFGFPDIMFGSPDVFSVLLDRQKAEAFDVMLALYPAHDCRRMDMVEFDAGGRVQSVTLKPQNTELRYAWLCAVWTSVFTDFMHAFLESACQNGNLAELTNKRIDAQGDLPVGAVVRAAVENGLRVGAGTLSQRDIHRSRHTGGSREGGSYLRLSVTDLVADRCSAGAARRTHPAAGLAGLEPVW